jgi:Family of unknown function (DUF6785)/Domain of unknown function (DUF6784)
MDTRLRSPQPTSQPGAPSQRAPRVERGVTLRAVLIGLFLIPINTYWVMMVEGIWHSNHATAMSLFWNTVFCIFLLVLLNLVIKRYAPRFAFNQGELIVIYVMITLATALAGHDTLQLGIPGLSFPFWFASPENKWATLFNQYFPKWLTVQDKDQLAEFYYGSSTLYTWAHLRMWILPVAIWCVFIGALGLIMICMNVILRKQWTENEKLSFPIVQLPLALTAGGGTVEFFQNKPLWYGFLLGAGIDVMNGLSFYYPAIPMIVVRHDSPERNLGQYITAFPWNANPRLWLPLYPFIIALGYFLPLDLSFSIWFFYLLRFCMVAASAGLGYQPNQPHNPPFLNEQSYGAWFAIFLYVMYIGRGHFVEVFRKALGYPSKLDDSDEGMTYRQALLGILAGTLFLIGFCLMAGMTLWVILVFFAIFFFISIAITRVRAELGPPAHEIVGMNAGNLMVMFAGTTAIGAPNLAMFTMFYWFTGRGYRSNPMPCQLEALKMAEAGNINMRGMGWVMMLAMVFGGLATFWAAIHQEYVVGAATDKMTGHNWGQYRQLQGRLTTPVPTDWYGIWACAVGAAAVFGMIEARIHWMWWPFHPAGYALSLNFGVDYFWSCLLISSIIKWGVIRYGGYRLNRQVMLFMFGLILGEYIVGAFWSATSVLTGIRTYDFAPG